MSYRTSVFGPGLTIYQQNWLYVVEYWNRPNITLNEMDKTPPDHEWTIVFPDRDSAYKFKDEMEKKFFNSELFDQKIILDPDDLEESKD